MPLKVLILWKLIQWFDYKKWTKKEIGSLAFLLRKYKILKLIKYFAKKKKKGFFLPSIFNINLLLFLSLFIYSRDIIGKWSIWKQPRRNTTLRRFYVASVATREIDRFIIPFAYVLGYTFEKLTKFFKVKVYFFLTNNNCVNAKFLSRFIARKLKQKYPVKELLNPIRKELKIVMKMSSIPVSSYYNVIDKKYIFAVKNKKARNNMFKSLLCLLFLIYNRNLLLYFSNYKTWFNLDFLVVYICFNKQNINNNFLINISFKYFLTKCAYLCFFESRINIDLGNLLFLPKLNIYNLFSKRLKYLGFLNFIYDFLYINKWCLWNINSLNYMYGFSINAFRSSNIHLNRYLKFNYWNYSYGSLFKEFRVNHLKSRIKEHSTSNNIKGYKMHLSGRFSRKQRAGSYWFSFGKVPLNSINSFIDYAFFTLPLANSAITVKVWLYKSSDIYNTFFYKLN